MAAIPSISPMFTPRKSSVGVDASQATPRDNTIVAQASSIRKRKTPASSKRRSFARKLLDEEPVQVTEDVEEEDKSHDPDSLVEEEPESNNQAGSSLDEIPRARDDANTADGIDVNMEQVDHADEANDQKLGTAGDEENEEVEGEYTFRAFLSHKWAGDAVEIEVEWDSGEVTWEPEINLHHDAPDTLFEYWRGQGGRPTNPNDPEMFEVFAIRKHNKNRSRLYVEWVGYEPSEASWVPRKVIEETAPEVVEAYWESVKKPRGRKKTSHQA